MKNGRVPWSRVLGIRAVIVLVVMLALLVLGLGVAVWARRRIGRNWGTPTARKEEPDLVTSGPYRLVRHPIYSGILLAGVGTAIGLSWSWLVVVAPAAADFTYSAMVEERYVTERFPHAYQAYRQATKMLVPFVF